MADPISDQQLRTESAALLRNLTIELPTTRKELLNRTRAQVEAHLGRPVKIIYGDPGSARMPSGMWLQAPDLDFDVIWIDSRVAAAKRGLHFAAVLGHEYGHMLHDHRPAPIETRAELDSRVQQVAADCPGLSAEMVAALMGRCGSDEVSTTLVERQAETTGRLLIAELVRGPASSLSHFLRDG